MKKLLRNVFFAIACIAGVSPALAEGPWLTSIEEGLAKAKKENKLVMVEFTGSDWCPPCMMMDKEVFSKEEFLVEAQKHYVLVKMDAPKKDPELRKATQELMKKLKVSAYPTILLYNAEGEEFTRFPGTQNRTVESFIKHLLLEKRRKDML